MKQTKLENEEQQILKDIEKGKYKSIPHVREEIKRLKDYAKNTFLKNIHTPSR